MTNSGRIDLSTEGNTCQATEVTTVDVNLKKHGRNLEVCPTVHSFLVLFYNTASEHSSFYILFGINEHNFHHKYIPMANRFNKIRMSFCIFSTNNFENDSTCCVSCKNDTMVCFHDPYMEEGSLSGTDTHWDHLSCRTNQT